MSPLITTTTLGTGVDLLSELIFHKRKILAGPVIGASTVLALSLSVALSPLIIGGIVGAISGTLFAGSTMPSITQHKKRLTSVFLCTLLVL